MLRFLRRKPAQPAPQPAPCPLGAYRARQFRIAMAAQRRREWQATR